MAAGRERPWAISQFLCVVVSAALDPILVPWFQAHRGNGGLVAKPFERERRALLAILRRLDEGIGPLRCGAGCSCGTGGPAGVVGLQGLPNQSDARSPYNVIGGSDPVGGTPRLNYFEPIVIDFVAPGTSIPATTEAITSRTAG